MLQIADQKVRLGDAARRFLAADRKMLIDGQWVDAQSGRMIAVVDPATGLKLVDVPAAGAADVDRAVAAARRAFEGAWSAARPVLRERLLLKLADLLEANADEMAELETIDSGKLLMMSRHGDLTLAIDSLRYMAGWATNPRPSSWPSLPWPPPWSSSRPPRRSTRASPPEGRRRRCRRAQCRVGRQTTRAWLRVARGRSPSRAA
ncbi:MAG: aldehyde dehydrogenase family protein [Micrococcales bacterium]|nr:aldehyde dehydrogenase family protein [Micrococcales bacterium]